MSAAALAVVGPSFASAQTGAAGEARRPVPEVAIPDLSDPSRRGDRPPLGPLRALRILTDDDYPPFHYQGADGQLAGLNVDLARALCEELRVACTVQARRWDTLVDALVEERGDAILASFAVSPRWAGRVAFTNPYLRNAARFVARRGADGALPPAPEAGRSRELTIAVPRGTAHEAYLDAFFPEARRVPTESAVAAADLVRRGEARYAFADGIGLAIWLNGRLSEACCAFVGEPYPESRYFGAGMAIAVRPGDVALRRALDHALTRVFDTGRFAEMYLRSFPHGFY